MNTLPAFADAFLAVGLITSGCGAIFWVADRDNPGGRALALSLLAVGLELLIYPFEHRGGVALHAVGQLLETFSILAGLEWARRVGHGSRSRRRRSVNGLLRAAQILTLVYGGLTLGYLVLWPQLAMSDAQGLIALRGVEWAVFAPVLGTAMLLAGIALLMLLFTRNDPAETIRLRALLLAAPFLLGGLLVHETLVPMCIALGLLVFLAGAVRYLIVQTQRGAWLAQFLAPEVARVVRLEGMHQALRRERRVLTALVCDLRGFTAYTQEHDSETVMNLLARYYAAVGAAAAVEQATVKDHAGDGLLLLLGAPVAQADHALRAARLAAALHRSLPPLLQAADASLGVGVGIATGPVTVGAIQGAGRLEYVAVGPAINLAARLCALAAAGETLSDAATQSLLGAAHPHCARTAERLKGYDAPVAVFALGDGAPGLTAAP